MKAPFSVAVVICALFAPIFACGQQSPAAIVSATDYEISGVVSDSVSGQKLGGINVRIAPAGSAKPLQTTKTGTDGSFSFHQVPRGKYGLEASGRGYPEQSFNQHEYYSTAIAVGPGLKSTGIEFRLHPEATIRGTVVDEENDPVENAMVRLFTKVMEDGVLRTRVADMRTTDDLGHFSFTHLPEAAYYVAVSARPWYSTNAYRPQFVDDLRAKRIDHNAAPEEAQDDSEKLDTTFPLTFYDGALSSAEATAIDLQPGQTATADITLRAIPAAHIRIPRQTTTAMLQRAGENGGGGRTSVTAIGPSVPAHIQLFHTIFDDLLLPADAVMVGSSDGFELTGFAPGHYVMQVIKGGQGRQDGSYREIDLAGDMDLPADTAPLVAVSGLAKFDGATPPAGMAVVISNRQLARGYGARIAEKGEFTFTEPIMPGRYEISVGGSSDWYLKSVTASGAKISGRTLDISGSAVRLTLEIGHGLARVEGLALRNTQPVAGAMILLIPQDAAHSSVLVRRDQSDSDGTFTLYNVVPGQYALLAIEDGWRLPWSNPKVLQHYLPQARTVQIFPGARTQLTLDVQKAH